MSGVVKVHGQVLNEGEIVFDPSNYVRNEAPRTAPIGKDGKYTITTFVGQNTVRVSGVTAKSAPATDDDGGRDSSGRDAEIGYLEAQIELRPGQTSVDVELPAPLESAR